MANTFDTDLIVDTISQTALTVLGNKLPVLNAFSLDVGLDEMKPLGTVQVDLTTVGSAVATNPTTFGSTGATTVARPVVVNHYSVPFGLTAAELNQGKKLTSQAKIHAQALADKIIDVAFTPMTSANFGTAALDVDVATFAASDMKTLWKAIEKVDSKQAILSGDLYANIMPTDRNEFSLAEAGAYGFDGIHHTSRISGAGTNVTGFIGGREAIAIAAGLPVADMTPEGEFIAKEIIQLEGLGLAVQLNIWYDRSSRSHFASYDVMFGAGLGDATAGEIIIDTP